ncbi:MAG: ATP-binding protein [Cyanobacteria bacterium J06650_10]
MNLLSNACALAVKAQATLPASSQPSDSTPIESTPISTTRNSTRQNATRQAVAHQNPANQYVINHSIPNQNIHQNDAGQDIIKVLLVDDQPIIAEYIRRLLVDETDIELTYCQQAEQAIAMATEVQPTVILQDLTMPDTNGLKLVQAFRANASTRDIPVIVLSTQDKSITKAEAFKQGANDYLIKVPEPVEFIARLRYYAAAYTNLLKLKLAEKASVQQNELLERRVAERTAELESALKNLRATQAQLIQDEKMSSLGQLVAGVAHEINNPVSFICGNLNPAEQYAQDLLYLLSLYQQEYPNPTATIQGELDDLNLDFLAEDFTKLLGSMKIGTQRIKEIVLSLRNFSRLDESEKKAVDIHEGINSTLTILASPLRDIEVDKRCGDLPLVACLPGQLNQVFMNILTNAIAAVKTVDHPKIAIQTERASEDHIKITITDNGSGMTPAVRERIFDPFYTTKPIGEGTGLGLSISHHIVVKKHSGELHCCSTSGKGTTFSITIPIADIH